MAADVTIVVSTYNRAETLEQTLRCAMAQTVTDWRMLVIGDACTDRTDAMIAALGDDRITFINLPQRFGEQSGPNSVGMALASGDTVAFLNHDDYWLPTHLEEGLTALEHDAADLYWSRAAFFINRGPRVDRAIFVKQSPTGRSLRRAYHASPYYSEPMSSWIGTREIFERVGPMTAASGTLMMPIQDYCTRLWRSGCRLACGDRVTVLKNRMTASGVPGTVDYALSTRFADDWVRQITRGDVSDLMSTVSDDLFLARALGTDRDGRAELPPVHSPPEVLATTGVDLMAMTLSARGGHPTLLRETLAQRTGEQQIQRQPALADMVAFARAQLAP